MRHETGGSDRAVLVAWSTGAAVLAAASAVAVATATAGAPAGWKPVLLPLVWLVPGVLLAGARPRRPHGWLLLVLALVFVLAGVAGTVVAGAAPGDAGVGWWLWVVDRGSAYVVPLTVATLVLLPDGRLPSRAWRPVLAVVVGVQGLLVTTFCLLRGPAAGPDTSAPASLREVPNPVGVLPAEWAATVEGLDLWLLQVPLLVVPVCFWDRWRRAAPELRPRLAALLLAAAVFVTVVVVGHLAWPAASDVLDVAASALVIAVLVRTALGRDGVEVIVHRSVVWVLLTLGIAGGYVVVTALAASAGARLPPFAAGAVAAILALALLPVREVLQRWVGRLLHGHRDDPLAAIDQLVQTAHAADSVGQVLQEVATSVTRSTRAAWVTVSAGERTARAGGDAGRLQRSLPLDAGPGVEASLRVGVDSGRAWGDGDDRLLEVVARHAGLALRAALLAEAVTRSRDRVVAAREEERGRVGRDLHDDLGPRIAALSMELGALRGLVATDPPAAVARIERLEDIGREALADVRRLARELRPPSLSRLGLVEALRRDADLMGVDLTVVADDLLPVSPETEVAAYRIGQQALVNVARHAGVRHAALRVDVDGDCLRLSIADEGSGLAPDAPEGVGLAGMRERAEELGGSWRAVSRPGGGTEVVALLPLGPVVAR